MWDLDQEIRIPVRRGIVYIITNKVTNDTYIGATSLSLKKRWRFHRKDRRKRDSPLHHAMYQYGSHNFTIEHLVTTVKFRDLALLERDMIAQHKPTYNRILVPDDVWSKLPQR